MTSRMVTVTWRCFAKKKKKKKKKQLTPSLPPKKEIDI